MAYTFEAGDKIEIEYENEDGETRVREVTVEFNTTNMDPDNYMGSPKARLYTTKKRYGINIILRPDGTLRAQPRYNANGRGENGVLKDLSMISEAEE